MFKDVLFIFTPVMLSTVWMIKFINFKIHGIKLISFLSYLSLAETNRKREQNLKYEHPLQK